MKAMKKLAAPPKTRREKAPTPPPKVPLRFKERLDNPIQYLSAEEASYAGDQPEEVLDEYLYGIGLEERTANALSEHGILTVREILNCTKEELLGIANIGEKTLQDIFDKLAAVGFKPIPQYARPVEEETEAEKSFVNLFSRRSSRTSPVPGSSILRGKS